MSYRRRALEISEDERGLVTVKVIGPYAGYFRRRRGAASSVWWIFDPETGKPAASFFDDKHLEVAYSIYLHVQPIFEELEELGKQAMIERRDPCALADRVRELEAEVEMLKRNK